MTPLINNNTDYRITDAASLKLLFTRRKMRYRRFIVDLKEIDTTKAKQYEIDLNKFHNSCGCGTGKHFIASMILVVVFALVFYDFPIMNRQVLILFFAGLIVIGFIGKVTGKLMAAHQFKKTVNNLYEDLLQV